MSDLVGVEEVRWDKGGTEAADDYTLICKHSWVFYIYVYVCVVFY
jgi:hypothetical protein